jgi:hypothetical protein
MPRAAGKIHIVPVTNGTFNVFGIKANAFVLEGNLTLAELEMLAEESAKAIKEAKAKNGKG